MAEQGPAAVVVPPNNDDDDEVDAFMDVVEAEPRIKMDLPFFYGDVKKDHCEPDRYLDRVNSCQVSNR